MSTPDRRNKPRAVFLEQFHPVFGLLGFTLNRRSQYLLQTSVTGHDEECGDIISICIFSGPFDQSKTFYKLYDYADVGCPHRTETTNQEQYSLSNYIPRHMKVFGLLGFTLTRQDDECTMCMYTLFWSIRHHQTEKHFPCRYALCGMNRATEPRLC